MNERLDNAPCGFLAIDIDGYILETNDTFRKWLELSSEEIIGSHFESLLTVANKLVFYAYFYPTINLHGNVDELMIKLKNKKGHSKSYIMNARKTKEKGNVIIDCVLIQMEKRVNYESELKQARSVLQKALTEKDEALEKLKDIYTEIKEKQVELVRTNTGLLKMANTDKLTGIYNRKYFQEQMDLQFQECTKNIGNLSILIIDIDFFKVVNDTYGHQVGDIILAELAQILVSKAREWDVVTRFGGEEFVIILPYTDCKLAETIAEKYRKAVESHEWPHIESITISSGISTYTKEDTQESLLKKADEALYVSKKNGRNRVSHYDRMLKVE